MRPTRAILGLNGYYEVHYPDYYAANQEIVNAAVDEVLNLYQKKVYETMEPSWGSASRQPGPQRIGRLFPLPRRQASDAGG